MAETEMLRAFRAQVPRVEQYPEAIKMYLPKSERMDRETLFRTSDFRSWNNPNGPVSKPDSPMRKTYVEVLAQDLEVLDTNFEMLRELCLQFQAETLAGRRRYGYIMVFPGGTLGQNMAEQCYRSICGKSIATDILHSSDTHGGVSTVKALPKLAINGDPHSFHDSHQSKGEKASQLNGKTSACSLDTSVSPQQHQLHVKAHVNGGKQAQLGRAADCVMTSDVIREDDNEGEPETEAIAASTQIRASRQLNVNETKLSNSIVHSDTTITSNPLFANRRMTAKQSSPTSNMQGNRILGNLHLQRRSSGGSDDMSISSGQTASEVPSIASSRANPRCCSCKGSDTTDHNPLIRCGCHRYYHAACHKPAVPLTKPKNDTTWRCSICTKRLPKPPPGVESRRTQSPTPREHLRQLQAGRAKARQYQHSPYTQSPLTLTSNDASDLVVTSPLRETFRNTSRAADIPRAVPLVAENQEDSTSHPPPANALSSRTSKSEEHSTIQDNGLMQTQIIGSAPLFQNIRESSNDPPTSYDNINEPLDNLRRRSPGEDTADGLGGVMCSHLTSSSPSPSQLKMISSNASVAIENDAFSRTTTDLALPQENPFLSPKSDFLPQCSSSCSEESGSDLSSLPDEEPQHPDPSRPKESYNDMIRHAIESSSIGRLDGRAIVEVIRAKYRYYRETENQKRLYSNVHALLSMGKKEGKYVKHDPYPESRDGLRTRCTYSVTKFSSQRPVTNEHSLGAAERAGLLQVPDMRSNRSSAPRRLASVSPSPSSHSRQFDQDQEMRTLPLGDVGYRIRNHSVPAHRIVPKNGLPEWEVLPRLAEIEDSNDIFAIGDMVKVLTDSPDDEFGLIFDIREVGIDRIAVAILWYRSCKDLTQILSHKNRREWPEGYKYMLSNEIDVINLKAIERKADAVERRSVFPGTKVWDCSGRPHLIRDCAAKEVAWVFTLIGSPTTALTALPSDLKIEKAVDKKLKSNTQQPGQNLSDIENINRVREIKMDSSVLGKRKRNRSLPFFKSDECVEKSNIMEGEHRSDARYPLDNATSLHSNRPIQNNSSPTEKFNTTAPKAKQMVSPSLHNLESSVGLAFSKLTPCAHPNEPSCALDTAHDGHPNEHQMHLLADTSMTHGKVDQVNERSKQKLEEENVMLRSLVRELMYQQDTSTVFPELRRSVSDCEHLDESVPQLQQEGARVANMRRQQSDIQQKSYPNTTNRQHNSDTLSPEALGLLNQLRNESHQLRVIPELLHKESVERESEIRLLQRTRQKQEADIRALSVGISKKLSHASRLRAALDHDEQQWHRDGLVPSYLVHDMTLAKLGDPENKDHSDFLSKPIAGNALHLKSQKKKTFGQVLSHQSHKFTKYGETPCAELRAVLNIPLGHVISSYEGKLVYRDDTRASDGSLLHPDAIYPLDDPQTTTQDDGNN